MKQLFKRLTGSFLALVLLLSSMPQSLTAIENCAFDGCSALEKVFIPNSVTEFGQNAFAHDEHLIFLCSFRSMAMIYALEHGIPMIETGSLPEDPNSSLNAQESFYRTEGKVSATGFLPMVAHYAFRPDAAVDRMQLRFSLPTQPELQTTSITLDGVTAGGEVTMHLMLAAYDPDGRMCAMIDGDLTIEPGGTGFKSLTYTAEQQVNTVKIFLVDPGTMKPPGSVFTITDAGPAIKAA